MKKDVIRLRPLISDEILEKLSRQDVATVHEAMGQRGAMTHNIRPIRQGMKLCGRALTVKCHAGDNLMLIKAVSMAQKDDVIVADMAMGLAPPAYPDRPYRTRRSRWSSQSGF